MASVTSHSWACDRARQAVSLRLDGELSQLERAVLDRHLERCPSCAEFAADTASFTGQLRTAELVPVMLPLRRRADFRRRSTGAWIGVASVAATALLAVLSLPAQSETSSSSPVAAAGNGNQDLRELREVRLQQLRQFVFLSRASAGGPQLDT